MAKTLTEAKITTREQRKKLPAGIHWRGIDPEVHLGYRKGKRGGSWLVRWYDCKKYQQQTFATADDELREGTLDFSGAIREARQLVEAERRTARAAAEGPTLTVRDAIETYVTKLDARESRRHERDVRSDARSRLSRYVIGQPSRGKRKEVAAARLADIPLHKLSEDDLLQWRADLPDGLKATSKTRLINYLKAALNEAFASNRSRLPASLDATIRFGLRTLPANDEASTEVAREKQVLPDVSISRVIRAARDVDVEGGWDGDLLRMVVTLAATGARFSQVRKLRVRDVQPEKLRLMMPDSEKGKGKRGGNTPVPIDASDLDILQPAFIGRDRDDYLLERWASERVPGGIGWKRVGRRPWRTASELDRAWKAIRERVGLPNHIVVYALRHSSIVRRIRLGMPTHLVAAMHNTSIDMIEDHYGRHIADALDELAAKSVVRLVPEDDESEKVVRLERHEKRSRSM